MSKLTLFLILTNLLSLSLIGLGATGTVTMLDIYSVLDEIPGVNLTEESPPPYVPPPPIPPRRPPAPHTYHNFSYNASHIFVGRVLVDISVDGGNGTVCWAVGGEWNPPGDWFSLEVNFVPRTLMMRSGCKAVFNQTLQLVIGVHIHQTHERVTFWGILE